MPNDSEDDQPKPGCQRVLYMIGPSDGPKKIGIASDPASRLQNLQIGCWLELRLWWSVPLPPGLDMDFEARVHRVLKLHHIRGEWFNVEPANTLVLVESLLKRPVKQPVFRAKKRALRFRKPSVGFRFGVDPEWDQFPSLFRV
jgi:hypothetical protein